MKKTLKRKKIIRRSVNKKCFFCEKNIRLINWEETEILKKNITERGKIIARAKTGTCAYHQRRLTKAIKRARHMALLPFTTKYL